MPDTRLVIPAAGALALGLAFLPGSALAAPVPAAAAAVAASAAEAPVVQVQSRRVVRSYGPRRAAAYRSRGNRGAALAAGAILGAVTAGAIAASRPRDYYYEDGYAPAYGAYDVYGGYGGYAPVGAYDSGYYGYGSGYYGSGYYGGGYYGQRRGGYYGPATTGTAVGGNVVYGQGYRGEGYYQGGQYLGAPSIGGPGN